MVPASPRFPDLPLVVTATGEEKCYPPRRLVLFADRKQCDHDRHTVERSRNAPKEAPKEDW
jgi:hypothetical protein